MGWDRYGELLVWAKGADDAMLLAAYELLSDLIQKRKLRPMQIPEAVIALAAAADAFRELFPPRTVARMKRPASRRSPERSRRDLIRQVAADYGVDAEQLDAFLQGRGRARNQWRRLSRQPRHPTKAV
jgi:hypothetical protein